MRKYILVIAATLVFVSPVFSQDDDFLSDEDYLANLYFHDLGPISVLIEELDADIIEKSGLTEQQLQAHVELKLRYHRIPLFANKTQERRSLESPTLYINVNTLYVNPPITKVGCFIYHVTIELRQDVRRLKSGKSIRVTTWSEGTMSITTHNSSTKIIDSIDSLLIYFMNNYLKANPTIDTAEDGTSNKP